MVVACICKNADMDDDDVDQDADDILQLRAAGRIRGAVGTGRPCGDRTEPKHRIFEADIFCASKCAERKDVVVDSRTAQESRVSHRF